MSETVATIKHSGPPTKNTKGAVGQFYIDTDTGLRWECVEANLETYYKGARVIYDWAARGYDLATMIEKLGGGSESGNHARLNVLETICSDVALTGNNPTYTFPSPITIGDDMYLLVYQYYYNEERDPSNDICGLSWQIEDVVRWGTAQDNNSVTLSSTGVTDTWVTQNAKSTLSIYRVERVIPDPAEYANASLEGSNSIAPGSHAHAEGLNTVASGMHAHAENTGAEALGDHSHAEGFNTIAGSKYQHVQGSYNVEDTTNKYAHILGIGTDGSNRANGHTIDWKGNGWFAGDVTAKGIIVSSTTAGSTKKFKISVDDTGALTASEVTN